MVLRIPLRRSASFTPDPQSLVEVPSPAMQRMEANVLVLGADRVGKSGEHFTAKAGAGKQMGQGKLSDKSL